MNVLKKALVLGAVGAMLAVPGYAKVVTGSQSRFKISTSLYRSCLCATGN